VIGTQAVTVSILPQILAMAAALHLGVIVEGVETSQQASYFDNADKSILAQGWYFGRPMPVDAFQNVLSEGKEETEHPFTVASEPVPCHAVFFESSHNPLNISSSSPI
jgi:sensor c-di-GMP phosphodiesterase-like protein